MRIRPGQTALITGASSGIGAVFARQLAERGLNVVLVARSEEKLSSLASELSTVYNVRTSALPTDLSQSGAAKAVHERLRLQNLTPDLLVNNAGFATYGRFEETSLAEQHDEVMVNVLAVVEFSHEFLPTLLAHRGGIINVASRGGFQPAGNMAVYAATKAFVISFSEALWAENRECGVEVLALCPGAVDTAFFDTLGRGAAVGKPGDAAFVVRAALSAYERGWINVIPGWENYLLAQLPRWLPRTATARLVERLTRAPTPKPSAAEVHS